jgi:hypothetical protein
MLSEYQEMEIEIVNDLKSGEVYYLARMLVRIRENNSIDRVGENSALSAIMLELYEGLPILIKVYKSLIFLVETKELNNPTNIPNKNFIKLLKKVFKLKKIK